MIMIPLSLWYPDDYIVGVSHEDDGSLLIESDDFILQVTPKIPIDTSEDLEILLTQLVLLHMQEDPNCESPTIH